MKKQKDDAALSYIYNRCVCYMRCGNVKKVGRSRENHEYRGFIMFVARKFGYSLKRCGSIVNVHDHTTIKYFIKKINRDEIKKQYGDALFLKVQKDVAMHKLDLMESHYIQALSFVKKKKEDLLKRKQRN